jgi:hypothetical protein
MIRKTIPPDEKIIASGGHYISQIDRGAKPHRRQVYNNEGNVRWRYEGRRSPFGPSKSNPFNKPDFVFSDLREGKEYIIRRVSFLPSAFQMLDGEKVIGRIRMASIFRNRYSIDLEAVKDVTFQMPLFSVQFSGGVSEESCIWVVLGASKMEWRILLQQNIDTPPLVAALAFIHNEWWTYS